VETKYFIRFAENNDNLKCDLDRGWSIANGASGDDKEYLDDLASPYTAEGECEVVETPANMLEIFGKYCVKLDGLCGYGPFDDMDEVAENIEYAKSDNSDEPWVEYANVIGIYEGYSNGDDGMGGDLFVPVNIVGIVKI